MTEQEWSNLKAYLPIGYVVKLEAELDSLRALAEKYRVERDRARASD